MISFKQYLIESEDKIVYHLANNPEHTDFIHKFLSRNPKIRSKYLEWAVDILNTPVKEKPKTENSKTEKPLTPGQIGHFVEYFHRNKHDNNFPYPKTIDSYNFDSLAERMRLHKKHLTSKK